MLKLLKLFVLFLLFLVVMIVGFQNLTTIQLRFLFSTYELPQAVVLAFALATGFLLGLISSALWRMRSWRAKLSTGKRPKETAPSETNT